MSGRGGGSIITAGAEAAKRARLERIVSSLKPAVVADDPEIRLCLEARKRITARRRIRSEICRSAGESGAGKLFGFGGRNALCWKPSLLRANA